MDTVWYKDEDRTWAVAFMQSLPLRILSRAWGVIHNMELPVWARKPVYKLWTWAFGCNLDEMRDPLESYPNLAKFFCRHLKPGVRPIADEELVSPVDARVTVFGELHEGDKIEQIKGMRFSLKDLIGETPQLTDPNNKVYYAVFYLAPGDYHRVHCPTDFEIHMQRHFPGELFSVAPRALLWLPNTFVLNERVALNGKWKHGFFSMVPVGAYNVGCIRLEIDEDLLTNQHSHLPRSYFKYVPPTPIEKSHKEHNLVVKKGEEVARFELGSTVVLIWEGEKDSKFEFTVRPMQKVKMGEAFGRFVRKGQAENGTKGVA